MDIQPGDELTFSNGDTGIALTEPWETPGWGEPAWWRVTVESEDEDDGTVYQLPWCVDGIVRVKRGDTVIFENGIEAQMSLWDMEAV